MAGIYSALGELDRIRKMAGRRVKDLVTDPLGVLTQQADDLRNTQRGVEPVINPAGAGMRPIPREEQVSRMTEQSLDTLGGGLGMLGHTVFHGSPRAFSKFDKAKMGTGEWGGRAPTEFEARHAAAQRNAALPVEQGGLGLPPNNTAMQRAYALGYTTPAYHGSGRDFTEFKNSMLGVKTGAKSAQKAHFFASNPEVSNTYVNTSHVYNDSPPVYEKLFNNPEAFDAFTKAETKDAKWAVLENNGMNYSSGQVMPVLVNQGKTRVKDYGGVGYRDATYNDELIAAKKAKKDSVELKNTYDRGPHEGSNAMTDIYAVFDPSNIRSRFAAFDPMKRHDADMLGFASPQLLGGMGLGGAGMAAYGLQDDQEGIFSRLGQYLRQRGMQ